MASKAAKQIAEVILVCKIYSLRTIKIQTSCFPDSNMLKRMATRIGIFMENHGNLSSKESKGLKGKKKMTKHLLIQPVCFMNSCIMHLNFKK